MSDDANRAKFQQMTQQPVNSLILRLAGPSIVIMMISALYNMADTYFVGRLGTSATAAIGIVFSLMNIIQPLGFFFGHGAGNCISRLLGAQETEAATRMAATGFFSALIGGALLTGVGLFFLDDLSVLLGATPTILPFANDYMFYILLGAPFMVGSLMLNNLLRFQGSSFYGMIGMVSGALLNIALDPILIFAFDLGIAGAGIATAFSQFVSCCLLFICCMRGDNIPIHPRNFSPKLSTYRDMALGGAPSLCRQGIGSVASILLNNAAGPFGDAAIAAVSVVNRVVMFASSAVIGFGQGFQPVCGFNYGAKRFDRVQKAFWFCFKVAFCFLCVASLLGAVFAPQVIAIFRNDPEVVRIGARYLRLQCIIYPLSSWVLLSNMMLQTIGQAGKASLLALSRQGIFLIPLLLVLPGTMGILGIQLCQPIADLCTFLLALPLSWGTLRDMRDRMAQASPPGGTAS